MIPIVTTPAILTDDIFVAYGGLTGTTTVAQRQAAYSIAEGQAIQEIGTFLESTIVTGTHSWPPMSQPLQLPYTHVSVISSVVAIHDAGCNCADDSVEIDGCAWLLDGDGGLVSLRECGNTLKASCSGCSCGHYGAGPLQVRVVYTAGLPANAANDPRLLMGLPARLHARRPSQAALETGLEVERLFDIIVNTQSLVVNERDEVEYEWPTDSPYYGERFRILGIQHDTRRPTRGHTEMTLSRIERSRSRQ